MLFFIDIVYIQLFLFEHRIPVFLLALSPCLYGIFLRGVVAQETELPPEANLNSPFLSPLFIVDAADPCGRAGIDGPRRADHAKQGAVLPSVPDEVRRFVRLASCGLWRASAGIGMLCDFVTGEDHLFPAAAKAEVIHVVPSLCGHPRIRRDISPSQ